MKRMTANYDWMIEPIILSLIVTNAVVWVGNMLVECLYLGHMHEW